MIKKRLNILLMRWYWLLNINDNLIGCKENVEIFSIPSFHRFSQSISNSGIITSNTSRACFFWLIEFTPKGLFFILKTSTALRVNAAKQSKVSSFFNNLSDSSLRMRILCYFLVLLSHLLLSFWVPRSLRQVLRTSFVERRIAC